MRRRAPRRSVNVAQPIGPVQTFAVDGLTHEAKGVARLQGKVTFIEGALPGETVTAQVTKTGRRFDEAALTAIISPSPYRVEPACEHFSTCGGCSYQHLADEKQLSSKADWLRGQLRHLISTQTLECLSDKSTGYRRRARIAIEVKKGQVMFGFRSKASSDIVSIDRCVVLTNSLQTTFRSLKQALSINDLASALGHVELLEDTKGVSVLFRLTAAVSEERQHEWEEWAKQEQVTLYWQAPKASKADVVAEKMRYYDLGRFRLRYHPQDFIQVNDIMNQKMLAQAMDWLDPTQQDVVLDLFCGVGNFSLPLAQQAQSVIGVEVQESMVEAARENARINGLDNLSFVAADLTKPIENELFHHAITKVLLDPPRAGAFEFLDSIIKIAPRQILYVSCNASTLARDAEYLVAKGYQVLRVGLMDMFPQTSHVESMMLLQKKK
ncbi:23S rRNA (uracil(1939)-C(5))-methyltransferase RlmD [Marinomonas sp. M1K-6]|uniref:23S rRNA (uracil(1939)-C(5))-methyltransferase RlmD n=1 Tax=Marinomonas profundi TaxID=2726122 RepID=A0A847RB87_9GAMM|nr:23S rRNA (uracil(1939)-C(5))-methyltransferase RlmD [Marinomonas profundi]NLQ18234.1 23S rRNA (uracil(1939)-C(5))-methyltransferase RlmD [Marinomonas profundi]UDV03586.1 23S rRNA (uracil(1939)-C(5))-methyltransferase RlmD [Marinomonas profundi]